MPRYHQSVINVKIADALRKMGFKAAGEIITSSGIPDVMVEIGGFKINMEGWFEKGVQLSELKSKCRERIENGICDIAIGLLYPETLREADDDEELMKKIKQSKFKVFVFLSSSQGINEQFLEEMNIEQIAEILQYLYFQAIKSDLLKEQIEKIEEVIQACAEIALTSGLFFSSQSVIEELKNVLGIVEKKENEEDNDFAQDLAKIAVFIIFNGLLFHQVISSLYSKINGLHRAPEVNILNFIKQEWKKIMKINYLPIFVIASKVIDCLPVSPDTDRILKNLIRVACETISSGVLLKHDLMGRVYHKLLLNTTGKYYAAFYTSIPAATLLSNLIIKTENPDLEWNFGSLEKLKDLKIIDPACGSGTLLSGIYMALKDKYILEHYKNGGSGKLNLSLFHKIMLEEVLHGWDILDYAGHLTLVTLALHNPNAFFERSNILILFCGKIRGKIRLGSLDLLNFDLLGPQDILFKDFMAPLKEKDLKEEKEVFFEEKKKFFQTLLNNMDVVIMNPPFSRSAGEINIIFGYVDEETRQKMREQLKKLGKALGYSQIGQAGLGAYFIILADKLLKPGGRLGLVIPRTILSGVSWKLIRELLYKNYEIEYIISNYDPGDKELGVQAWNWSENTDLGEVLIVARKTNKPIKDRFTTFINLWNKPINELESLKIVSDSIKARNQLNTNSLLEGKYEELKLEKRIGVVYNLQQQYLSKNFLIGCLFANPYLNQLNFLLSNGHYFPLVELGNLVKDQNELGIDRKSIHENFKMTNMVTPYKILWGSSVSMKTLELNPGCIRYGKLKPNGNPSIYNRASNFLITENIHLKTESIVAMYSEEKILATTFWEIQVDSRIGKILALWLNSTFGFLILLAHSNSSAGNRHIIKKEHIQSLPIININQTTENQIEYLLNLYEELKDEEFSPFSKEFELAFQGEGVRKQIDDAFIKVFNVKIDMKPYYEMLAKEPILTLERW